jgi:hypothetical protein
MEAHFGDQKVPQAQAASAEGAFSGRMAAQAGSTALYIYQPVSVARKGGKNHRFQPLAFEHFGRADGAIASPAGSPVTPVIKGRGGPEKQRIAEPHQNNARKGNSQCLYHDYIIGKIVRFPLHKFLKNSYNAFLSTTVKMYEFIGSGKTCG